MSVCRIHWGALPDPRSIPPPATPQAAGLDKKYLDEASRLSIASIQLHDTQKERDFWRAQVPTCPHPPTTPTPVLSWLLFRPATTVPSH